MINYKTEKEIEIMRKGGRILADVLYEVLDHVQEGVSELELDDLAEKLILEKGGEPGFKKVEGYNNTLCISTNDVVVHGVPGGYRLKKGDVVGIDCGVFYGGFHTDMSETQRVSTDNKQHLTNNRKDKVDIFLETGKRALDEAIKIAVAGNRVGHISKTIQGIVEGQNYSVVRSLIGHGVGKELHEEPEVPGFLDEDIKSTPLLKPGMTIAIEVIYNMGGHEVVIDRGDGWTIRTEDGSLSGLFERTIAITDKEPLILTA
ncbi:MAG: type I methionyl aminopeptidase [Candidatus Levybacteria bacterium]|nr:type I methionyl aminopeptidase [Candidatus Levybacteria bacterium]MBI2420846.1 type I methionyl aminopeptidase [Candidatus Levybacteria bacterium]